MYITELFTSWTIRGSNPGGGEIFRILRDRTWGPPSLLCNGYRVSSPGVKRPGRGVNHIPPSSVETKERTELFQGETSFHDTQHRNDNNESNFIANL